MIGCFGGQNDFAGRNRGQVSVFFSPKDERWRSAFDPKLAGLLSELELGLGSVVRQSGAQPSAEKGLMEEEVLGIHKYIFAERNTEVRALRVVRAVIDGFSNILILEEINIMLAIW